jgi:hypothetical protein
VLKEEDSFGKCEVGRVSMIRWKDWDTSNELGSTDSCL